MELTWGIAAIWLGLALVASLLSIRFKMSVALVEILVGIAAGNLALLLDHFHVFGFHWELKPNEWIGFLAGFGSDVIGDFGIFGVVINAGGHLFDAGAGLFNTGGLLVGGLR